ncbi:SdpI family protein [Oceanirhabdus sp. W0125-5]|uniref:SdpI family protein n=1 Tax=Oceanirhabdus sp. W0125-5 TaxID=2999116 RepID=UPI0022F2EA96|nr:SdpI family protein [Oceanirhabdus sp. W0125-5]WBW99184.1 SdpI family protein [Oceanirhabdus sp. W0125-5]
MGFWIFMMISNLLIPFTMVGFGKYFIKSAPKQINAGFGYRTSMSMKNKETWEFAHHYCGKLWRTIGWIMLVLSVVAMLFVIGKDTSVVGTLGAILCLLQVVFLVGSIFPTEQALKRNFDRHGNRKK